MMPTRILVVGAGGREHALAWKLAAEPGVNEVIVGPGSEAIASAARTSRLALDPIDSESVVAAARATAAELVVIGPEASLAAGVVDALAAAGIAVFGPTAAAARIESSKAFCHEIAAAVGVPMARSGSFSDLPPARAFAQQLVADGLDAVVKADGLAAGKGVTVCTSIEGAFDAIEAAIGAGPVVVEQRLVGREASLIALCDGRDALGLPLARDHKRLGDGDSGPNTGGMGAYSPLPDLPDDDIAAMLARFHRPILAELARRGSPFRGALYAGLMLTADGPILLECNARFGDPETQALMPRLATPLGPLLLACAQGRLAGALGPLGIADGRIPTLPGATVAIVLASAGYPAVSRRGDVIGGLEAAAAGGALVFHGATARNRLDPSHYETAGGRVLSVVGRGPDLEAAERQASRAADAIAFAGRQRRHDVAADALPTQAARPAAGQVGRP